MAPSSQMAVASLTSGMALASSALRTASVLGSLMSAALTPPPPPPIVKHVPKCGQRHENGLGVRIQGFNEYESQFGEWPHMCAVLAEEPVAQDPGYAGEPQTA